MAGTAPQPTRRLPRLRRLAGAVALLLLGGCAGHAHLLRPDAAPPQWSGRLLHGAPGEPARLSLERDGERFEGSFRLRRVRDFAALQARYIAEPKRLARIVAGLERGHDVNTARVELRSAAAGLIVCRLAWPDGSPPGGSCSDADGAGFRLRLD